MYATILAGGSGTRLWPRSRQAQPKQFADIIGAGRTLIQATVDRLEDLAPPEQIYVVVGDRFVHLAVAQLPDLAQEQFIVEPSGRNTAPAIGLACIHLLRRDPNAVVAILPADHVIPDTAAFQTALRQAEAAAKEGYLVTLGITPAFPHTGYGYIKRGKQINAAGVASSLVYQVESFLEKPNRVTAEAFVADGNYYWNGGIFVCRVDRMLAEMERQLPEMYVRLQQIATALETPQAAAVLAAVWQEMPNVSIDYGVMEGATQVAMTPLDAGWNDVGSWDALANVLPCDDQKNYVAQGEVLTINSQGNIIYSNRLVALIGVEDLAVIDTGDALLVGHRDQMQKVKDVVERLRTLERIDLL